MKRQSARKGEAAKVNAVFPMFCDFSCPHADFAAPDSVGACRRDVGVWCKKAKRHHTKHARCLFFENPRT